MHAGSLRIPCGSIKSVPHLNLALVNAEISVKDTEFPGTSQPKLGCVETSVTQMSLLS